MTNAKRRRERKAAEKVRGNAGTPNPIGPRDFRRDLARKQRREATVRRAQQRAWESWQARKADRAEKEAA